jgi:predicted ATPase
MKLANIKIKNFKSIKELDLSLNNLNILIGANGAGKSNFISFFKFLNFLLEDELKYYLEKYGGPDNLLYFGLKYSSKLSLRIDFLDKHFLGYTLEPTADGLSFIKKGLTISGDAIPEDPDSYARAFDMIQIYHFHDTTPEARIKRPCDIDDNRYLKPDGSNLPAFLYYLQKKHKKYFTKIEDTIRLVFPAFWKFVLKPDKLNEHIIQLIWQHRDYGDVFFKVHHLSDGTLRFMCLTTLLLQPELPDVILIDEPELGLHPYSITVLASILKKASKKSQIIAATQSVSLINNFEPEDIIVVDFKDNQSKFKRPDRKELAVWLEDYSLGEIWEKNIIGGRP